MVSAGDENATTADLRAHALALILKARAGERAEALLACIDDDQRSRIEALMAEAPADCEAELRRLRREELDRLERDQIERFGPAWGELSPAIRFWAWRRI